MLFRSVHCEETVDKRVKNHASAENEYFSRVSIFSCQTKWYGVLVVDLVNVFVEYTSVECLMCYMKDKAPGSSPYVCVKKHPKIGLKCAIFSVPKVLLCTRMSHSHDVTICAKM